MGKDKNQFWWGAGKAEKGQFEDLPGCCKMNKISWSADIKGVVQELDQNTWKALMYISLKSMEGKLNKSY